MGASRKDQWRITDVVGIPITAGAHGVALPSPTCTEFGATRRIRVQPRLGPIPTPGTMVLRPAVRSTIHKQAGAPSPDAATTPTSTRGTLMITVGPPHTTRTPASLQGAEPDSSATSTPDKARPGAAGSFTTQIPTPVWLPERTTSTPAKMAPYTATTEIAAVGPLAAETVGNPSKGHSQSCKANSKCATKARSETRTSTRGAASAVRACGAEAGAVNTPMLGQTDTWRSR
jgi:hypothetical protein